VSGCALIMGDLGVTRPRPAAPRPGAAAVGASGSVVRRTATLHSGEVVSLATMGERVAVRVIELVVAVCLVGAGLIAMAVWFFMSGYWGSWSLGQASRAADRRGAVAVAALFLALILLLPVIFETWRNSCECREDRRGRGRIRLIRVADGEPPTFLESAARALLPIGISSLAYVIALLVGPWSAVETIVLVGVSVWLVVHGTALAHPQQRGWADLLAGTVVIPARETIDAPPAQQHIDGHD